MESHPLLDLFVMTTSQPDAKSTKSKWPWASTNIKPPGISKS